MTEIRLDAARSTFAAGLAWLYDTDQPDDAIDQHHGAYRAVEALNLAYRFIPTGGRPPVRPVIVVQVARPEWSPTMRLLNPLEPGTMAAHARLLEDLGHKVTDQWNGDGCASGSLKLAEPAHPSLLAVVRRYLDHCPEHDSVFCGHSPEHGGLGCSWFRDGRAKLVAPTWPELVEVVS